jgi:DNA-binding LacI/PurR family transcriptional regulator
MPNRREAPKHRTILQSLEQRILTGRYRAGEKLPGEEGLAREFETSRITIGRAVNELQRRGLVDRRSGSGTYVRRPAPGDVFGLLIPDLGRTEVFDPICHGISSSLRTPGEALIWGHAESGSDIENQSLQLCQDFIDRSTAGVFFAPLEGIPSAAETNRLIAARLRAAGIAVVLLDRDLAPGRGRSEYDLVGLDNRLAGLLAAQQLLAAGRRRIGFVSQSRPASTVFARIAGYREALLRAGVLPELALTAELDPSSATETLTYLGSAQPDAVVCANDRTAAEWLRTLPACGRNVPSDLALCGVDDVEYAPFLPVPLTTIRQPCRDIGRAAMAAMRERLSTPDLPAREILLPGRLIVRQSCGGPANQTQTS